MMLAVGNKPYIHARTHSAKPSAFTLIPDLVKLASIQPARMHTCAPHIHDGDCRPSSHQYDQFARIK